MDKQCKAKILYVEDDEALSFVTRDNLEMHGLDIVWCADGSEGWRVFNQHTFDLCLLDVMLPKSDGFELAQKIRRVNADVPILFLTARTMKEDRITGLSIGADDYITKPFSIEELLLRITVFLQRPTKVVPSDKPEVVTIGAYTFDPENYVLQLGDHKQKLTQRETELLEFLARNRNRTLEREDILDAVWKNSDFFISRSLDVFVSKLRKYLREDPSVNLENIHGVGFRLKVSER
jgi:two-component system, OmpR family, response regulator VicR